MKLNVKAFALAGGILFSLAFFLLTYFYLIMGYSSNTLIKLSKLFLGYSITWYGGFIGLIWGFVSGLVAGAIFAWVYNKLADNTTVKA